MKRKVLFPKRNQKETIIYLTAYRKFDQLQNRNSFKAWLTSIARNKCNDYFRRAAAAFEIPIDALTETELVPDSKYGITDYIF